jgi:hypothetical protein
MTVPEVPLRFRAHPTSPPKPVPAGRTLWPRTALVMRAQVDRTGGLECAVLLEMHDRLTVTEQLVYIGETPPAELVGYAEGHPAHSMHGARRRIGLVPTATVKVDGKWDGLGYRLRDRGYRRGWPIVSADLNRQLAAVADRWSPARKAPGGWSLQLAGLGSWPDAPRVCVESFGNLAVAHWGNARTHRDAGDEDGPNRRPQARVGPFVDVLQAASALRGTDVFGLADACERFGIEPPGPERNEISQLRSEALAVAHLYAALVDEIACLKLSLDLGTLISTGGIGTALLREAGLG